MQGLNDGAPVGTLCKAGFSARFGIAHAKGGSRCEAMKRWLGVDERGPGVEFGICVLHG